MRLGLILLPLVPLLLIGCEPRQKAPHAFLYEGWPIQGSMADAQRAGFTDCTKVSRFVRCVRTGVMLKGKGPFIAAVDSLYDDGSGGFYELLFWYPGSQKDDGVNAVGALLAEQGWQLCRTGPNENTGDQEIYTKPGSPVRFSIDISYWGKRRLRILPELHQPTGHCW
jgi:hypothetical protein